MAQWFVDATNRFDRRLVHRIIINSTHTGHYSVTWYEHAPIRSDTRNFFIGVWETFEAAERAAQLAAQQVEWGCFNLSAFRKIFDLRPIEARELPP